MDVQQFIRQFRAHWLIVVLTTVASTVLAGVSASAVTPIYAARTQLFVSGNVASDPSEAYEGGLFSQQRVPSYAEMVSSRPVMQAVIRKLRLRQGVEELQAAIDVSVPTETVLINVTVEDPSPQRAKAIADVVAKEFASFVKALETSDRRGTSPRPLNVSVTGPAPFPTRPVARRSLVVYLVLGALWGLAIGLGAVLLREALARRIGDQEGAAVAAGRSRPRQHS